MTGLKQAFKQLSVLAMGLNGFIVVRTMAISDTLL
jgi:hypothetical protein